MKIESDDTLRESYEIFLMSTLEKNAISKIKAKLISYAT